MTYKNSIIGKKFGKLLVQDFAYKKWNGSVYKCKCECGEERYIHRSNLIKAKSCGCLNSQITKKNKTTHGLSKTRFYSIWCNVKKRVLKPETNHYKFTLKLCNRWKKFENFQKDMHKSYLQHSHKYGEKNTSIDRINNENPTYCKENCRWATPQIQSNNRNYVPKIIFKGKAKSLTQWSEIVGVRRLTLRHRIYKSNWTIEKALTHPVQKRKS